MTQRTVRRLSIPSALTLGIAIAAALLLSPTARGEEVRERWYVMMLDGQRAGWMRSATRITDDLIITEEETRLTVRRGATSIDVRMTSTFEETPDGHPIRLENMQKLGAAPITMKATYGDDLIEIETTGSGGNVTHSTQPLPEGRWLTPHAADTFIQKRLEAGAETIEVRTIDPISGVRAVMGSYRIVERTEIEALGKTVPAIKWIGTVDIMPGLESVEYVDRFGSTIRSELSLGAMKFVTLLADKDLALADVDPPELLVSTLVRPDRPIRNPRGVRRATYVLSGSGALEVPSTGAQRAEPIGDGLVRVTVDLDDLAVAPAEEAADESFLGSSTMIDSGDAKIRQLTDRVVVRAGSDKAKVAEALRTFVHRYVKKKSLGVGFASASEVGQTRAGDCTEHAVLLTAMLRAAGIPSRTASGLIYADHFAGENQIFGYHMWSQALLEIDGAKHWVDVDATLPAGIPTDATHILLVASALDDGAMSNAMVELAPVLGQLDVRVERTEP